MILSDHFTLSELTRSATADRRGLKNEPDPMVLLNLRRLAHVLEDVRALTGKPLRILSGYRSSAVNAAVGGSPSSYHCDGCAADFDPPDGLTHSQFAKMIDDAGIDFDKIIIERAKGGAEWIHLQIPRSGSAPRRQVLAAELDRLGGTITRITVA